MKTKIVNLTLDLNRRLLFISDIHGNLDLLKKGLDKVKFCDDDYLFILGDFIEKHDDNISILDYIMMLDKKENVFVLQGNCDNVLEYMISNVNQDLLKNYAFKKKNTILLNFAKKLNIEITPSSDMEELCNKFYIHFKKYYDYVLSLPHAYIINNKICTVHGGIDDFNNINSNAISLMKNDGFYFKNHNLDMIEIVGHYPTINYNNEIPMVNSIIDLEKKVISIDGGVSVIPWCQLNILVLHNLNSMNFYNEYVDSYLEVLVKEDDLNQNHNLFNITINPIKVEIEEYDDDFVIGYYNDKKLYILKSMLIKKNDGYYAYNAFNYFHSLEKNDRVSLVYQGNNLSIIKKDGVVGLCHTRSLAI